MPSGADYNCWHCGAALEGLLLPMAREAECRQCRAQLHVCRMCQHYAPRSSDRCDEPNGEHPRAADRANFCDYYSPDPAAWRERDRAAAARSELDALFGGRPGGDDVGSASASLDDLFRKRDE